VTIETDVLIVGGGIAGASACYHLAALGHRVALLERGDIASGASGVNGGLIDSIGWGQARDLHAHLTAGSLEIFEAVQAVGPWRASSWPNLSTPARRCRCWPRPIPPAAFANARAGSDLDS